MFSTVRETSSINSPSETTASESCRLFRVNLFCKINHDCGKLDFQDVERKDLTKSSPESKWWSNLSILIMFISLIVNGGGIKYHVVEK